MITKYTITENSTDLDYANNEILIKAVAVAINWAFEEYAFFDGDLDDIDLNNIRVAIRQCKNTYFLMIQSGSVMMRTPLNDWIHLVTVERKALQA